MSFHSSPGRTPMIGNVPAADFANAQRMVEIMAGRWYTQNRSRCSAAWDEDDARAAARYGLVLAAERFDPALGYRFNTFAGQYAMGYVKRQLRQVVDVPGAAKCAGRWSSTMLPDELDRPMRIGSSQRLADSLVDQSVAPDANLERFDLWPVVALLPPIQARVIRGRFQDDRTLREMAEELGLSHERVRQIEVKALRRLRMLLTVEKREGPPPPVYVAPPLPDRPPPGWPSRFVWTTVQAVSAALDAANADLRYGISHALKDRIGRQVKLERNSVSVYVTAIRKARGVTFTSRPGRREP